MPITSRSKTVPASLRSSFLTLATLLVLAGCGAGSEQNGSSAQAGPSAATEDGRAQIASVPDANGNYPDWRGLYPDANGRYPDWRGFYPDAQGRYPDYNGLYPDTAGRYPDYRGLYPDEQGRYADWRGFYPDASGQYPTDAQASVIKNEFGWARNYSTAGFIDTSTNNPFFKPFGNGRSCGTCHDPAEGFTITPKGLQDRFARTNGDDPIFRQVDGTNSPNAPVGTLEEKRAAYSMLLDKGVIRIGLKIPANAQFELVSVQDPYGYASANELSLFRRVLPSTNLPFLGTVMWDGRESLQLGPNATPYCLTGNQICFDFPFTNSLKTQAQNATTGHAQFAQGLSAAEQQAIVDFETKLFTAQEYDNKAQFLMSAKGKGGTKELSKVDYYFDINGFLDPRTGQPGNKLTTMQVFSQWLTNPGSADPAVAAARASIARGEKIFNTKTFTMVGVAGTNGNTILNATCTNCHKTPQVGSLSVPNLFNIGAADPAWNPRNDLPLYTLRNTVVGSTNFGRIIQTYDPGLALNTGRWGDIGKVKVPSMRGLATRAPYFHNGTLKTVEDTTDFYIRRFNMVMTPQEIADLNTYLKSL